MTGGLPASAVQLSSRPLGRLSKDDPPQLIVPMLATVARYPMKSEANNHSFPAPEILDEIDGQIYRVAIFRAALELNLWSQIAAGDDTPERLAASQHWDLLGTRMLLDYELKKADIDPAALPGYEREVTTHIAVALAVKSGEADAGMCVYSAAKALGLPFVPVAQERYELAFRKKYAEDPRLAALIAAIRSPEFKKILNDLGGYDTKETGHIRKICP